MKTCSKCETTKPVVEFSRNKGTTDGLRRWCKKCSLEDSKAYRLRNPSTPTPRVKPEKSWYERNSQKTKTAAAKWAKENPEKVTFFKNRYRENNPEKLKARNAEWASNNRDKTRVFRQNRRAKESTGKLSTNLALTLYIAQEGKCACCSQPLGTTYHLDHIMPLALGGTNTDDNIQLLLPRCNRRKSAKHPDVWLTQIAKAGTVRASVTQTGHPE